MINLDQVRTLEWKVKQAVQLIVHLRRENDTLRGRLSDTEVRLQELEAMMEAFKATQNEMESGIRSALEELDNLEGPADVQAGPVDPVSYPPTEPAPVSAPVVEAVAAAVAPEVAPEAEAADEDLAFEEEFAALAAAEEAALAGAADDAVPPVPESVELEDEVSPEETDLFDEPAAPAPVQEEHKPEQPGLGIF